MIIQAAANAQDKVTYHYGLEQIKQIGEKASIAEGMKYRLSKNESAS